MKNCICISGEELNLLAASYANAVAGDYTVAELATLSALFSLIGDAFGVIAAQREVCKK